MAEPLQRYYHGSSMGGTFRPGDRLSVMPVDFARLRRGDVVVFLPPGGEALETVHRVVATCAEGLVTRGDNNPFADSQPLSAAELVGRVTHAQRGRRTWRVADGWRGLLRARLLRLRFPLYRLAVWLGGPFYRWLRRSGLAQRLWHPSIQILELRDGDKVLFKYIHRGRTVAEWRPLEGRFTCRKPYDLLIPPPQGE